MLLARLARAALGLGVLLCAARAAEPTQAGVRYGPHERHVLDFWKAASSRPTGVLIFFHGGSFKGGDKRSFAARAPEFLDAGISVVSANYRFSSQAVYPGPMLDGARVVQFVRSQAKEWNVDPSRVAVSGSSAGAALALWIALHDDLASPQSPDPIERISTRVACASLRNGATSMDPELITKLFGAQNFGAMLALFGARSAEEFRTPEFRKKALDASAVSHLSKDDPPLFLWHGGGLTPMPTAAEGKLGAWIHHARFGELLKQKCDRLGVECHFYHRGRPAPEGAEIAFLRACFQAAGKSE